MSLILSSEPANTQHEVIVILRQGTGANKVSWPNNVDWAYGSEPVLAFQQGKYDRFQLIKLQGQNNWMASTVGGTYG